MRLWTDGRRHVQIKTRPGRLRVFEDGVLGATGNVPIKPSTPLGVDGDAGRVYLRRQRRREPLGLVVLSFDELQAVEEHDLDLVDVTALGGGEVAVALGGRVSRLAIGRPGQPWRLALDLSLEGGRDVPVAGLEPGALPVTTRLDRGPHGLAVADGVSGSVAVLRDGARAFDRPWFLPPGLDLWAQATRDGVVVLARDGSSGRLLSLKDRDSTVLADGLPWARLQDGAVVGWDGVQAVLQRGEGAVVRLDLPDKGPILALATAPGCAVLGTDVGLHELRWSGDDVHVSWLSAEPACDVATVVPGELTEAGAQALLALVDGFGEDEAPGGTALFFEGVPQADLERLRAELARLGCRNVQVETFEP